MMSWGKRCRRSYLKSRTQHKTERKTNIESLPDKLLFDILVRLPADFLHGRARLVCPRWWRIIRSDAFINTNFQQHSTNGLLLSRTFKKFHSIYVTATQGGRVERSDLSGICRAGGIWSAFNGLAVELIDMNARGVPRCMRVINLATKQSLRLPTHNRDFDVYYRLCGITYSAASMKYYIVIPDCYFHDILTVGVDKSWRCVVVSLSAILVFSSNFYRKPISTEGFMHWASARYCVTLNVETDIFTITEAPVPPGPYKYDYRPRALIPVDQLAL